MPAISPRPRVCVGNQPSDKDLAPLKMQRHAVTLAQGECKLKTGKRSIGTCICMYSSKSYKRMQKCAAKIH